MASTSAGNPTLPAPAHARPRGARNNPWPTLVAGALGTSVLVSLIGSRVGATFTGELTAAGVPAATAGRLAGAEDAAAMGIAPVAPSMPGELRHAVIDGTAQAFMNGLHAAVLLTGLLCVIGAVISATGVHRRTDHLEAAH